MNEKLFTELKTKLDCLIETQAHVRKDFKEVISDLKIDIGEVRIQSNQNMMDITTLKGISKASAIWSTFLCFVGSGFITMGVAYTSIQSRQISVTASQNQFENFMLKKESNNER